MSSSNRLTIRIDKHWFLLLVLFVSVWVLFNPSLDYIHAEVTLGLFIVYAIPIFVTFKRFSKTELLTVICSFIFLFLITAYKFLGVSSSGFDGFSQYYGWAVLIIIGITNTEFFSERENKIQFYGLLFIALGYTVSFFFRSLTLSEDRGTRMVNAAYSSMLMIFSGVCFVWFLNDKRAIPRIISMLGAALTVYLNIFVLQRGTNFVLTLLMAAWLLLNNSDRKSSAKKWILIASVVFFLIYISGILEQLLKLLASKLDFRLSKRINEILVFLQTGDFEEAGGFSGRTNLHGNSIKTWFGSPLSFIFGAGDHRATNLIIGNHSEMIDVFARFGLIGGINLWALFFYHFTSIKQGSNAKMFRQAGVVFAIYALRNLLGTTMTGPTSAVIIILISLVRIVNNESLEKEKAILSL